MFISGSTAVNLYTNKTVLIFIYKKIAPYPFKAFGEILDCVGSGHIQSIDIYSIRH